MFTNNPFAELSASIAPSVMQNYVIVMIVLVAVGTIYDVIHKKSAQYFLNNWRNAKKRGAKPVGVGEKLSVAAKTVVVDVMTSGEFCSMRRRIAHLLTMYGFLAYMFSTIALVFCYASPTTPAPEIVSQLWHIGASMICVGGYWFWFFIRVDVAAEGNSPFRIVRADLFVLTLIASATFSLGWSYLQVTGSPWAMTLFGMQIIATTVLFGSVPWSKFAHMFFKPAAAFEKRMSKADGSRSNLPAPADIPETFGSVADKTSNY